MNTNCASSNLCLQAFRRPALERPFTLSAHGKPPHGRSEVLTMKTPTVIAMCLATACWVAYALEPKLNATLQACNDAMKDYDAVRGRTVDAEANAKKRVLQECFKGSGRSPTLHEPITIDRDSKAPAPVRAAPVMPTMVTPSAPSALTSCDAGGCWDNLGIRYNGIGSTLSGPAGKPCIRSGNWIECR
jgi:hypothetical protein